MKSSILSLLLFIATPAIIIAKEINVVLIGGQSNATGQGVVRNLPQSYEANQDVLIYYSQFLNRDEEGSLQWKGLCQASDNKQKFGPELGLGNELQEQMPDQKFALIKHTRSGANLHTQWNPGNRDGEQMGDEYSKFLNTVKSGLEALKADGYTPIIRAMVWQQGEADARFDTGNENTYRYPENLRNFINHVRNEFDAKDMIFVYGKVMPMAAERFTGRDVVRAAQIAIAEGSGSDYEVKGAYMIECDDLQMQRADYKSGAPKDDVHLGSFGLLELGRRYATVIVNYISNQK